jgi:orotate phosphoribosyltransferase
MGCAATLGAMPDAHDRWPNVPLRILVLVVGTLVLYEFATLFASIHHVSVLAAGVWVVAGAVAIVASLAMFCERIFFRSVDRRVRLSTLFLLFIPFAVYLTAIRSIVKLAGTPNTVELWIWSVILTLFALVILTALLLYYGEAWASLVLGVARLCGILPPSDAVSSKDYKKITAVVRSKVLDTLVSRRGHFRYESGHHGDLWLDLESFCRNPTAIEPLMHALAADVKRHRPAVICGPLVEGAFVALLVANKLEAQFVYTERIEHGERAGLFPVEYRVPTTLRSALRGKRVAIVNDVINAGSAVRGTAADLKACGAEIVAIATAATIGTAATQLADEYCVPLYSLTKLEAHVWAPDDCQLCRDGVPLQN